MAEEMNIEVTEVTDTEVTETKETENKPTYEELEAMLAKKDKEYTKLKSNFDKTSSDVAGLKRELKARKTDDENAAEAQAEKDRKLAIYEKSENLQKVYAGMDAATAKKIAELEADGDFTAVHEAMNEYIDALVKQKSTDALMNRQRVNAGSGSVQVTKEQFANMTLAEKSKLYRENKAEYDRLNK